MLRQLYSISLCFLFIAFGFKTIEPIPVITTVLSFRIDFLNLLSLAAGTEFHISNSFLSSLSSPALLSFLIIAPVFTLDRHIIGKLFMCTRIIIIASSAAFILGAYPSGLLRNIQFTVIGPIFFDYVYYAFANFTLPILFLMGANYVCSSIATALKNVKNKRSSNASQNAINEKTVIN